MISNSSNNYQRKKPSFCPYNQHIIFPAVSTLPPQSWPHHSPTLSLRDKCATLFKTIFQTKLLKPSFRYLSDSSLKNYLSEQLKYIYTHKHTNKCTHIHTHTMCMGVSHSVVPDSLRPYGL